ncbi:hypothetical protein EMIT0194P_50105 [Pseudomonas serbica]
MRIHLRGSGSTGLGLVAHDGRTVQVTVVNRWRFLTNRGLLLRLGSHRRVHGIVDDLHRLLDFSAQTGSNDSHVQLVAHVRIDNGTDLDHGVLGSEGLDDATHVGVLTQGQVRTGGDVHQDAACTLQVHVFEQRVANGRFGGLACTVRTAGAASAHHRHAHFAHHGTYVGKVDVDHARTLDDVGDTANGTGQYIVSLGESRQQAGVLTEDGQQFLVGNGDQRVDAFRQQANAFIGDLHALAAFERERTSHHRNGENPHFLGHFGNDRRSTGTGTAAHASGDEHHVGALQDFGNALTIFESGLTTYFRVGTSAQTFGHAGTQLQDGPRANALERLGISVGADEFDAFNVALDHVIHGVAAATAYTDNFNNRACGDVVYEFEHFPSPLRSLVFSPTACIYNGVAVLR